MTQTSTSNATYTQLACLNTETRKNEQLIRSSPYDSHTMAP